MGIITGKRATIPVPCSVAAGRFRSPYKPLDGDGIRKLNRGEGKLPAELSVPQEQKTVKCFAVWGFGRRQGGANPLARCRR